MKNTVLILLAGVIALCATNLYANPGEPAIYCVNKSEAAGKVTFTNNCEKAVFIIWCGDLKDTPQKKCGDGGHWFTHSTNLGVGKATNIETTGTISWGACIGGISWGNEEYSDSGGGGFVCKLTGKEKAAKEKAEKDKADKEKAEKEKALKEKADKERAEKEKAEKEKAKKEATKDSIDDAFSNMEKAKGGKAKTSGSSIDDAFSGLDKGKGKAGHEIDAAFGDVEAHRAEVERQRAIQRAEDERQRVISQHAEEDLRIKKEKARADDEAIRKAEKKAIEELPKGYVSQGGLTWMPTEYEGYTYNQALTLCSRTINGQNGWRLPTKEELIALQASGAWDGHGWSDSIRSSTPTDSGRHFLVVLKSGGVYSVDDERDDYRATCVR